MVPKVIGKIKTNVSIHFNRSEICRLLNVHYYGIPACNKYKDGEYVPIMHRNRKKLEKAHNNICSNKLYQVEVEILEDGTMGKINFL